MECAVVDCSESYEKEFTFSRLFDDPARPKAGVVATLARATEADVSKLRRGAGGERRRFLVLLREDRLRWALSLYCNEAQNKSAPCIEGTRNPQFLRRVGGVAAARREYNARTVWDIAEKWPKALWRRQLLVYKALRDAGAPVALATYENFLGAGPALYAAKVASFAVAGDFRVEAPFAAGCTAYDLDRMVVGAAKVQVQKVHSEDIRDFVSNYLEVQKHFDERPLPTFDDAARDILGEEAASRLLVLPPDLPLRRVKVRL